jgi:hypothetical protein
MFPEQMLTPIAKVVEVVLMLLDGAWTGAGAGVSSFGQAIEICGGSHYFRDQIEFCDATMAAMMGATDVDG